MFFNPNENIYKLSPYYYIFKYHKDEFQNNVNNNNIMNIITNARLHRINIIDKNDVEYISIYRNIFERSFVNEINDNEDNGVDSIRKLKINKNVFKKK